jgi:hypothetical protein
MKNAFLFETKEIEKGVFQKFKSEGIFYSHFLAGQKYYLFLFKKESIDLNFLYQSVELLNQLDSRKRQIRSIRGFILYALELMEKNKDSQILETNLEPFFWKNVQRIINQNKKNGLQNFLFSKERNLKRNKSMNQFSETSEIN